VPYLTPLYAIKSSLFRLPESIWHRTMTLMMESPDNPDKSMTLIEHLDELRTRLFYAVLFLLIGVCIGFFFVKPMVRTLVYPLQATKFKSDETQVKVRVENETGVLRLIPSTGVTSGTQRLHSATSLGFYLPGTPETQTPDFVVGRQSHQLIFLGPLDMVFLYIKASTVVGILLALPFILWQIWLFIVPGLTRMERKTVLGLLGLAGLLFPLGAAFAYLLFRFILGYLLNMQLLDAEPQLEMTRFIDLELKMMLGFGCVFEFPVLIILLTMLGLIEPAQLRRYRKYAYLGIMILAMLIAPPDPFSMLLITLPLIILYEVSIWACVPLARKRTAHL
jgi:sec-independent protein translocase protein TatC